MNHYSHCTNLQHPYHYMRHLPAKWVVYDHAPYNTMPIFNPYYAPSVFNPPNVYPHALYHQTLEDVFLHDAHNQSLMTEYEALLEESLIMLELETYPEPQRLTAGTSRGSGLSEEEISKHLHVYEGTMTANCEGEEADVCSICLDEYEVKMGRFECGHRFHEGCIKRCLLSKNICPLCRSTALMV
ncbi:hypothetical protein R6Q57_019769 [Mikania cordata]